MDSYDKRVAAEKKKYHGFEKYEAEGFARTLMEAGEILADDKKMKAASLFIEQKKKAIKSMDHLKKVANSLRD